MSFCRNCGNQVSDGTKFCPKCGQSVDGAPQQQVNQQPYVQAYQQPQQRPIKPSSNMVWAILTTILCCLPTGVYAIIRASKVDGLYASGEYEEAESAANDAKKWSIIGVVLAVIGWIVYIVFLGGLAFLGAASSGLD